MFPGPAAPPVSPPGLRPFEPADSAQPCAQQTPKICCPLALLTQAPPQSVAWLVLQQDTWLSSGSGPKAANFDLLPDSDPTARSLLSESEPSLLHITNPVIKDFNFFFNNSSLGWVFFRAGCGFWPQSALNQEKGLRAASLDRAPLPFPNRQSFATAARSRRLPVRPNYGQLTWRTPPRSGSKRK